MLLNPTAPKVAPQQRIVQLQMSVMLKSRNLINGKWLHVGGLQGVFSSPQSEELLAGSFLVLGPRS